MSEKQYITYYVKMAVSSCGGGSRSSAEFCLLWIRTGVPMANTPKPGYIILLRETFRYKWVVVGRFSRADAWHRALGGGKMVAVKGKLDEMCCHQLDHIEVLADASSKTGEYQVELHCSCGRHNEIPKKDWEALVDTLQADDAEQADT